MEQQNNDINQYKTDQYPSKLLPSTTPTTFAAPVTSAEPKPYTPGSYLSSNYNLPTTNIGMSLKDTLSKNLEASSATAVQNNDIPSQQNSIISGFKQQHDIDN